MTYSALQAWSLNIPKVIRTRLGSLPMQRIGFEFFWIMLGQILGALGGMVGVRLLTNALTPASYGEVALGATFVTLVQQVVYSPLCAGLLRFFAPAQDAKQLNDFLGAAHNLLLRAAGIVLGLGVAISFALWCGNGARWLGLMLVALLFSLISGYRGALDHMQIASRQRVVVAWHQALDGWLRFPAAVAFIAILGAFSYAVMIGFVVSVAVTLISQLFFFSRSAATAGLSWRSIAESGEATALWQNQIKTYALPVAGWGLFTWAQFASDRWALQTFSSTDDVGLYAVVYQLGYYPLTVLFGALLQLVIPILFRIAGDGSNHEKLNRARQVNNYIVAGSLGLTAFATLLAFLFHTQLFHFLVGPQFQSISVLLPVTVFAGGLFGSGQLASQSLLAGMSTKVLLRPKIITAILGTSLNCLGGYLFGVKGVVFASALFSFMYFCWMLRLALRSWHQPAVTTS